MLEFFSDYSIPIYICYIVILIFSFVMMGKEESKKKSLTLVTAIFQGAMVIVWLPLQANQFYNNDMGNKAKLLTSLLDINTDLGRKRGVLVSIKEIKPTAKVNDKYWNVYAEVLSDSTIFNKNFSAILERIPSAHLSKDEKELIKKFLKIARGFSNTAMIEMTNASFRYDCILHECSLLKELPETFKYEKILDEKIKEISSLTASIEDEILNSN